MLHKKIVPTKPATTSFRTAEGRAAGKAAGRTTVGMKFPRKTGRKTLGRRGPGG